MQDQRSFDFGNLCLGDHLELHGDDIYVSAVVIKIHPHNINVHWHDLRTMRVSEVSLLGMYSDDLRGPSTNHFLPYRFSIGMDILYVSATDADAILTNLSYVKITRDEQIIFELGEAKGWE